MHICIDEDGHLVIRSIKDEKEVRKLKVPKEEFRFIKFNPLNESQFFLCSENSFKVFDVRTNLELESIDQFANSIDLFSDTHKYLLVKDTGLGLYNSQIELENEWTNFGRISHASLKSINYGRPDMIIVGNEAGDLFCSE